MFRLMILGTSNFRSANGLFHAHESVVIMIRWPMEVSCSSLRLIVAFMWYSFWQLNILLLCKMPLALYWGNQRWTSEVQKLSFMFQVSRDTRCWTEYIKTPHEALLYCSCMVNVRFVLRMLAIFWSFIMYKRRA